MNSASRYAGGCGAFLRLAMFPLLVEAKHLFYAARKAGPTRMRDEASNLVHYSGSPQEATMTARMNRGSPIPLAAWGAALLGLLAACLTAVAQTNGPVAPQRPSLGQPSAQQERPPIRVSVQLVSTPVVVHDSRGELVLDLAKNDFRIYDNGLEQSVEEFDMGGGPLSAVFVVETSSRIDALLPAMRRTGILFTQTVLGENAEAAVIGYHDAVTQLLDFTSNSDAIEKTFTDLTRGTSGARLYDGLSQAVRLLRDRPPARRRVIVTMAEATDTGSEDRLGDVLREAQLANITIYSVGLSSTAAEHAKSAACGPGTVHYASRHLRAKSAAGNRANAHNGSATQRRRGHPGRGHLGHPARHRAHT